MPLLWLCRIGGENEAQALQMSSSEAHIVTQAQRSRDKARCRMALLIYNNKQLFAHLQNGALPSVRYNEADDDARFSHFL